MENENKNANNHHKKGHHQRSRAYYIEPNTQSKDTSTVISSSLHENTAKEQGASHKSGQRRNKHHRGHNQKNNRPNENEQSKVQTHTAISLPVEEGKPQNAEKLQGGNHHKRNNRQKLRTVSENKTGPAEKATDITTDVLTNPLRIPTQRKSDINLEEYEEIRFPSAKDNIETDNAPTAEEPVPMVEVIGIRFKSSGKVYYFAPNGTTLHRGEYAIVETARGQEFGEVAMGNKEVKESETVSPLRPVIRIATEADKQHHNENKQKEDEAFKICNEKIAAHKLEMKLIDAQYTFDNSKLLFYFTSAGRVDFRELVKDLASVFKTRIELRQIGIRDEAKIMGGVGMCGRPLCCTLFLSDFGQVSIKMAKEQNLSLNSAKISGICGRLMCCLRYEHETYEYEIKRTPPVDALVHTSDGNGTVTEINPLLGTVKVRLTASPETPPKLYRREDVVMLQKKQNKESE